MMTALGMFSYLRLLVPATQVGCNEAGRFLVSGQARIVFSFSLTRGSVFGWTWCVRQQGRTLFSSPKLMISDMHGPTQLEVGSRGTEKANGTSSNTIAEV